MDFKSVAFMDSGWTQVHRPLKFTRNRLQVERLYVRASLRSPKHNETPPNHIRFALTQTVSAALTACQFLLNHRTTE